jgi:uncharacterized linocin/CFP29 family protein
MNGNLGRDRVWNDHIWSEIDQAVREEVGRIRVAQKVFPSTTVNNALPVSTAPGMLPGPGVDQFQPFLEIAREFVLTQAQVDGEENMRLGRSRARLAASQIATAEDRILFFGRAQIGAVLNTGVTVTNRPDALPRGFVGEAENFAAIDVVDATADAVGRIITAVAQSMARLNGRTQPGPYALFLSPNRYAQTFAPAEGMLRTPGDQINYVVTGGFSMLNSLPNTTGILVSLGGEPAKIILGTEAMTAFAHTDPQGNYHFRVFERIQLVVQDGRAFQRLAFP